MNALAFLLNSVASAIFWLVLIYVILGWLVAFNVINLNNNLVRQIYYGINGLVEPMLAPIRRILPTAGGIDFSPIVLLIGVEVLRIFIMRDLLPALM